MSECTGPGCTHPEHAQPRQEPGSTATRLIESGFAPEKVAVMNRAERRAALRRIRR